MIQYSRLPAIIMLLVALVPGAFFLYSRHSDAAAADSSRLPALKAAISKPDATAADWLAYAQTLQELKRYDEAAWGYQRLVVLEPANAQARLQGGVCIALTGNADDFAACVDATIKFKPTLAVEMLKRPEAQPFLDSPRFKALKREADAQSMD